MKKLFIPAYSTIDIEPLIKKIKLKQKLGLVSSVQFLPQLKKANKILKNSIIGGQILGCNVKNAIKIKNKVDAFLYIGSAYFYPIEIAVKTSKPVYIANPFTQKVSKVSEKETEKIKKVKLLKFYSAKTYGILVSIKPGQYKLKEALTLQKKLLNSYIFIFNNFNENELENFPNIDFWVNTACPRIESKKIINLEDLSKLR